MSNTWYLISADSLAHTCKKQYMAMLALVIQLKATNAYWRIQFKMLRKGH